MRIKSLYILLSINVVTWLLFLVIALMPDNFLRIVIGLPLVLFFPGYALLAALFPRKGSMGDIERFALSFGMSIAVVPLLGLALNYTPWGIRLYPILFTLAGFILAMSVIAWYRARTLPPEETLSINIAIKPPSFSRMWSEQSTGGKVVSGVLALLVVAAVGTLVYVVNLPRSVEKFTEFYVLNAEGQASDYPSSLRLGQSAGVILGITNHESETTLYRIEVSIDGASAGSIGPLSIEAGETWEQPFTFTPTKVGENEKVEFRLYKNDATESVESLHLWVEVR